MLTNIKQKEKKETQAKKHNEKIKGVILMYIIDTDDLSRIEKLKKFSALGYACSVSKGYYDATYKILKYLKGEPVLWQEKEY